MSRCAKCEGALQPFGEPGSSPLAERCAACGGIWIAEPRIVALEDSGQLAGIDTAEAGDADRRAGRCPLGHGLLERAPVDGGGFHLDRCGRCGGIWFDAGEWSRTASALALAHLGRLWDPASRRVRREQEAHERSMLRLREELGGEEADALVELARRLADHPLRARLMAVAFLQERLSSGPR